MVAGKCANLFLKILDTDTDFTDDIGNLGGLQNQGYNVCGPMAPPPIVTQTNEIKLILNSNSVEAVSKPRVFKLVLKKTHEAPTPDLSDGINIGGGAPSSAMYQAAVPQYPAAPQHHGHQQMAYPQAPSQQMFV